MIKRMVITQMLALTSREMEVRDLMVQGLTNQQIGERLCVGTGTIKNHVFNVLTKTGTKNRTELAYRMGYEEGRRDSWDRLLDGVALLQGD